MLIFLPSMEIPISLKILEEVYEQHMNLIKLNILPIVVHLEKDKDYSKFLDDSKYPKFKLISKIDDSNCNLR